MPEADPVIPDEPVMPRVTLTVPTAERMRALGRALAAVLRAGDLVILSGGLGAGKTTLTQGIGDGLGVRGPVTSPTFVIARIHPVVARQGEDDRVRKGRPPLVHVDAYRLGGVAELDDLDLDTDVRSTVTVVEWGEGLAEGLSADRLQIAITAAAAAPGDVGDGDEDTVDLPRTVRVWGVGGRWEGVELPLANLADRL